MSRHNVDEPTSAGTFVLLYLINVAQCGLNVAIEMQSFSLKIGLARDNMRRDASMYCQWLPVI